MSGSYQLKNFTENIEAEVKRLKAQVELFFEKEFEIFKKLGLKDGMSIIECGSGPGYLISNLKKQLPNCSATALEIDPYLFEILSSNSEENGVKQYQALKGSIYEIDLPDESVDFAVSRLVVEHLQDPYLAFAELRRILKPDGILVIVSNDFAYHVLTYPVIPELDDMFDAYNRSRFDEGGNPLVGRQLPVFFDKSGFKEINIELTTANSKLNGDDAMLAAENVNISRSLVQDGYLKEESFENLLQKWYDMLQHPDHIIYRQLFIVGGKKDQSKSLDFKTLNSEYKKNFNSNVPSLENIETEQVTHSMDIKYLTNLILNEWKKSLEIDEIDVMDNFFDIGGQSIMIPEIIKALSDSAGVKLKILDFFKYTSIQSQAEYMLSAQTEAKVQETEFEKKQSIRSNDNNKRFSTDDEQKSKLKAQRNKFKSRRK